MLDPVLDDVKLQFKLVPKQVTILKIILKEKNTKPWAIYDKLVK